jgi:two-component system sensor histidine kinase KdpD
MPTILGSNRIRADLLRFVLGLLALAGLTTAYLGWFDIRNATFVGLSYLLVILLVSAASSFAVAAGTSVLAVLALNFFFMPPVRRFILDDPQNWVALVAFLAVGLVASRLSETARLRAEDAAARRDELSRLFDLSRDVLLTTGGTESVNALAAYVARRFTLDHVVVCLPTHDGWRLHESSPGLTLDRAALDLALAEARGTLEFDAQTRTYGGHRGVNSAEGHEVTLVPLRLGIRAVGLLAAAGRRVDAGTLDAIAGLAVIAIERARLLDERRDAERVRQGAELKSALLSSLGHDLRTPLTAITVAANNLRSAWGTEAQRREQLDVIGAEVSRLNRLFENIVDMARIETGGLAAEREWVHPADIVDAAVLQVQPSLSAHALEIDAEAGSAVQVDPRLTSAALAHLLENAGQYAPAGTAVEVTARVLDDVLTIAVRDHGAGISPDDQQHLFDRFYRGADARRHAFGTGMGLAITRGLVTAQGGRVWAENHAEGGAVFTLAIPSTGRPDSAATAEGV